jgi:hypothetical protein
MLELAANSAVSQRLISLGSLPFNLSHSRRKASRLTKSLLQSSAAIFLVFWPLIPDKCGVTGRISG